MPVTLCDQLTDAHAKGRMELARHQARVIRAVWFRRVSPDRYDLYGDTGIYGPLCWCGNCSRRVVDCPALYEFESEACFSPRFIGSTRPEHSRKYHPVRWVEAAVRHRRRALWDSVPVRIWWRLNGRVAVVARKGFSPKYHVWLDGRLFSFYPWEHDCCHHPLECARGRAYKMFKEAERNYEGILAELRKRKIIK